MGLEGTPRENAATVEAVRAWRQSARSQATAAHLDPQEVDWLLRYGAGVDRLQLQIGRPSDRLHLRRSLVDLSRLWQRRLRDRVPVQYLVGWVPWREFDLAVSPAVLIPRPETEAIVDLVAEAVRQTPTLSDGIWLDLGTGSGAIALGLATVLPRAQIVATDCSEAALAVARENAERHGLGDRLQLRLGSWFDPLDDLRGRVSGVVSNPPYIPRAIVPDLQPEVARHEPHLALDGGEDGLAALRHLVATAPAYLQPGGLWLVELMSGQSNAVAQRLREDGRYEEPRAEYDLAGHDRFVWARRRATTPSEGSD